MAAYTSINIIYNPNSTGDSQERTYALAYDVRAALKGVPIECVPTKYAGHAEEMAYGLAVSKKRPLIISSSGDGGYNEVVNGVLKAGNPQAVCAVLPAGNANDHSRTMQTEGLYELIIKARPKRIDAIKVEFEMPDGEVITRYAHSYVGLGLTPVIATELNRHTLNAFREIRIVLQRFYKYRPFKIRHDGKLLRLNSLVFANINRMAKVLTLAEENRPDDGKFEIVQFQASKKRKLLGRLFRAAVSNLPTSRQASRYEFRTLKQMPMQLDGEVIILPPRRDIVVSCAHLALKTLV